MKAKRIKIKYLRLSKFRKHTGRWLPSSVKKYGQWSPILVVGRTVIDGALRVRALKAMGRKTVFAYVIPWTRNADTLRKQLEANMSQPRPIRLTKTELVALRQKINDA